MRRIRRRKTRSMNEEKKIGYRRGPNEVEEKRTNRTDEESPTRKNRTWRRMGKGLGGG